MKSDLTYSDVFSKLKNLVEQLEEGNIPLDKLSSKVKQANELITVCETKLRNIQTEIKDATKATTTRLRGKK
jgi:exodeoxyribonuclease VII small subunit